MWIGRSFVNGSYQRQGPDPIHPDDSSEGAPGGKFLSVRWRFDGSVESGVGPVKKGPGLEYRVSAGLKRETHRVSKEVDLVN